MRLREGAAGEILILLLLCEGAVSEILILLPCEGAAGEILLLLPSCAFCCELVTLTAMITSAWLVQYVIYPGQIIYAQNDTGETI